MIKNWLQLKSCVFLLVLAFNWFNSQASTHPLSWDRGSKPSVRTVPESLPTLPDFLEGFDLSALEYDPVRAMYYMPKKPDFCSSETDKEKVSATNQMGSNKK
jgi:hypothetical protein